MQLSHRWKTYTGLIERASSAMTRTHDLSGRLTGPGGDQGDSILLAAGTPGCKQ